MESSRFSKHFRISKPYGASVSLTVLPLLASLCSHTSTVLLAFTRFPLYRSESADSHVSSPLFKNLIIYLYHCNFLIYRKGLWEGKYHWCIQGKPHI